jgi:hypothetical protein
MRHPRPKLAALDGENMAKINGQEEAKSALLPKR